MKKLTIFSVLQLLLFVNIVFAKDVEYSLERAPVLMPFTGSRITFSEIKLEKPTPAMIYLHGCGGINPYHDLHGWGEYIAKMGFVVVLPNSFDRPNRIPNCNTVTKSTGFFPSVWEYRQQEIAYTLEQLKRIEYIDINAIFLMGHSEGGVAVAQNSNKEFKGAIISGWTCARRDSGLMSSKETAVLAIAYTKDPWYDSYQLSGRCIDFARGRNVTQIDLKGYGHDTFADLLSKDAVYKFLSINSAGYQFEAPRPIKIDLEEQEKDEPLVELSAPIR